MTSNSAYLPTERRAVAALVAIYSVRMLGLFMVLPLLGLYAQDLVGATAATVGLALGAYGLTQAMLQIPLGWLSDRIGRRPIIVAGLMSLALGSVIAATADSITGVIIGRAVQGCGAIAAALSALAADCTRESQRTKTMAFIGASVGLSFMAALVLGPLLAARGGLETVFMAIAGLSVIALVLVLVSLPAGRVRIDDPDGGRLQVGHVLGGPLPVLYASIGLVHAMLMATFLIVPGRLVESASLAVEHHWWLYLVAVVLSLPPALGLMRWGRSGRDPRRPLMLAVTAFVLGQWLALESVGVWLLAAGLVLFFIGVNALEALLPAVVSLFAPGEQRGTAMGVFATAQFGGIFLGGALGGLAVDIGGPGLLVASCLGIALFWLTALNRLRVSPSTPS